MHFLLFLILFKNLSIRMHFHLSVSFSNRINEKYELIPGKMGFALIGEHETNVFNLILYQDKQKPIASAKVFPEFILTVSLFFLHFINL